MTATGSGGGLDGIAAGDLAERWGAPVCEWRAEITSTFDLLHELAARGAPAGTVILADTQTAGRGREGRTWRSPLGGAWLSVLYRPAVVPPPPDERGEVASMRIGREVALTIDALAGAPVTRLKWPNDVLIGDRKVAGVLCEARWQGDALQWLGAGVGINVTNPVPDALRGTAIALVEVIPDIRRIDVLDRLVPRLLALPLAVRDGTLELLSPPCC